ncbi:c-type cytochrome [Cryomorpha ignava]|uniref:C-type cytochrome n=1 Tax=Cryomorpha ignava TaxID=101383 RepID=A0A7K3WR41_9FLAO|nr:cbb3-type cytochrome c oxidase N-terminal domain-containing protein [Cryomorpha ignava]NEN23934.1 c-type cytochrome [Cryomorpha ignava]
MNKAKIIATIILSTGALPLLAQATGAATSSSSFMNGPNIMLGLVAIAQLIAIVSVAGYIRKISGRTDQFIKMRKIKDAQNVKHLILLAVFTGFSGMAVAQDATAAAASGSSMDPNTLMLLVLNFVLLLVFAYVVRLLFKTVSWLMPPKTAEEIAVEAAAEEKQTTFSKVFTDAVPVEREDEIMLDHEYDGIRELDNNLPPWWVWMFYATIIYAFVYLIYYHVLPYGQSQEEEYISELKQADMEKEAYLATAKNLIDENSVVYLEDAADLAAGKTIYLANCQACHQADGGGGVGPNLTDEYWIHGGGMSDIFKTVKYGVPTKGMIAWESQLNPTQMAQVSSFIHSLSGTVPASPKEPQGEVWRPENSDEIAPDSLIKEEPITPAPEVEKEEPDKATAAVK